MSTVTTPPAKPTFEQVVRRHGATVLRVVRAVADPADADDAWSETFISALRAYPDLPADANVEAWLVRIAHRRAIDQFRQRARRPAPTEQLADEPSALGQPEATGGDAEDLWSLVRSLPERQRQAVAYHYLGGLPYAEVADIVGRRTEAVRRAAADGIAKLRHTYPALLAAEKDA